ncbi:U3 small nucleolar ribonucleoprotein complex subunit Mpp10p [Penicillium riverlandense]|uniref:U3 small nucleolar ribonucleoprotein complex subunit Mpp10p n=1 Tax=Penicillium riverlandense TaxID=1903569 RepID=UPI002548F8BD|nr:U3 small nucleolar ribonucleoprotein complex subunit Mpp10p [Penicillium riverlandense]KAJ5812579.1 U3 small nucleolar ribonucleoprotein complex subunit Mpp10p [Penicillium riverlandense]
MAKRRSGRASAQQEMTLPSVLSSPWAFLRPTTDLHSTVTDSAKQFLDPLAASIVDAQFTRRQINKKRKRSELGPEDSQPLQLKNLYVDGFTSNQIWEQATRILESAGGEIERDIALISKNQQPSLDISDPEDAESISDSQNSLSGVSEDEASIDGSMGTGLESDLENSHLDLEDSELADEMAEPLSEDEEDDDASAAEEDPGTYADDKFGLNDGFFSIDDFNRQSELLERQDAMGAPEEDEDSSDEIDWHTDPLLAGNASTIREKDGRKKPSSLEDDEDDSSEEEGPTFGNADLNADSGSDDDENLSDAAGNDAAGWVNTSDIKYADFFAPPPRKVSSKKTRALPKTQPKETIMDEDIDRAMDDVRRDLFDDEPSDQGEEDDMDESPDAQGERSTHEKQRARIADEIRRLEAANVAKKEWMLAGEARAVERPVNSLIEEDLDFERVGKPVPVVTNETTEDIEELVKRRILANEFDEVLRRRPGASDTRGAKKSRFELDDTKPQQSLAELYETDHLRATDPNFVDAKDRKLMRDHAEINNLWKEVSSQLDTLSNWHYKPKAPQANINVVTDAPTIMMEEARPTAGSAAAGPTGLAPQEIYAPGDDGRVAGEVVLKNGASASREEMTREEKARLRRQQKKNKSKEKTQSAGQRPSKAAEKEQLVSDLKKGGVKVIDKEGRMTNVDGGKVSASAKNRADTLKL